MGESIAEDPEFDANDETEELFCVEHIPTYMTEADRRFQRVRIDELAETDAEADVDTLKGASQIQRALELHDEWAGSEHYRAHLAHEAHAVCVSPEIIAQTKAGSVRAFFQFQRASNIVLVKQEFSRALGSARLGSRLREIGRSHCDFGTGSRTSAKPLESACGVWPISLHKAL